MGLKQEIREMFEKYGMTELHFKLPMLLNLHDDVVATLDEATKQIQDIYDRLNKNIDKRVANFPEREFLHGILNATRKEVLTILDGEKKP